MKINIILPSYPIRPGGGHKIMYEYANRLFESGNDVVVYHSLYVPHIKFRMPLFLRNIRIRCLYPDSRPKWFDFKKGIPTITIQKIRDKNIRDADITMSTNFATAFDVVELSESKGVKVNLIQSYETWISGEAITLESYQLPIHNIVINDYLFNILTDNTNKSPLLIYNAIDSNKFHLTTPIDRRKNHSVCMLFSKETIKGSKFGIEAIKLCKERYPDMEATLFGVFNRPKNLPEWIVYHKTPSNLVELYNNAAIYISPSLREGWALPPAEAMNCGCALICTDIGGHAAYGKENETALLVKPENTQDLFNKISELFDNQEKRIQIAKSGNDFIKRFSWEQNINTMLNYFNKLI